MNILEKEIEDIIWNAIHSEPQILSDRGLYIPPNHTWFRQLDLGSYGIADMVSVRKGLDPFDDTKTLYVTVYELKKDEINLGVLLQAASYCKGILRIADKFAKNHTIEFRIRLIGKTLNMGNNFCYLPDCFPLLQIFTFAINMTDGIKFHNEYNYKQNNEMIGVPKKSLRKKFKHLIDPNHKTIFDLI